MDQPIYHLEGILKAKAEDTADFVGPLDLILHLLSKNKLEIQDISVSQILDQYLEWVARRKALDLEVASDFIAMASHLMYIKSRMLLSAQDEEALSEVEQLIASLEARKRQEEFQKIQGVLFQMAVRYEQGSSYLTKLPEVLIGENRYCYAYESRELVRSMQDILARREQKLPPPLSAFQEIVRKEPYSVGDKARELLKLLGERGKLKICALFVDNQSRSELVATFVAVLELIRGKRVCVWDGEENCLVGVAGQANKELKSWLSEQSDGG